MFSPNAVAVDDQLPHGSPRNTFAVPVTELERMADCSSAWFVDRLLDPKTIDAEVDPKLRGSVAHNALHKFFAALPKELGTDRVPPERVDEAIRAKLARKVKIPGFGHRVYNTEDPRATHLRRMSKDLGERAGNTRWFEMSRRIEALVTGEKKLFPNVDFYSASTYYTLGIPIDLFTPIFAVSRVSGWTAHCLEQYKNNRLIRPRTDYIGPPYPQSFLPLDQR